MRAAVLREPGRPLSIEDLALADPHPGEVLVRVEAAGVCHSDYHYMTGDLRCPLPAVLGHEGTGVVEAVGAGVTRVRPGDTVCLMWRPRCGECEYCAVGRPGLCVKGAVQARTGGLMDGTSRLGDVHHLLGVSCFAERCVVAEASVVPVPAGIPVHIAAIAGCAVVTGVGAVLNVVRDAAGRGLLVLGAGGVGLSAVMGAALVGASPIVVADISSARLELAKRLGATHVVDAGTDDVVGTVRRICRPGAHWAVEAVGRPSTLEQAVASLRPGGTAVAVGLGRAGETFAVPTNELVQMEKRVVGSLYGSANPLVDLPRLFSLYAAGKLPLDRLLGDSYPLARVNEAYQALMGGSVGRAVIVP